MKDLRELIAWPKANPDKASLGTAGPGSPSHLGGMLFQNVTGTRFQFVPYRGTAPVIPDLVAGQIDMAILDPITSLPQFRGGRSRCWPPWRRAHRRGAGNSDRRRGGCARRADRSLAGMWAPKGTPKIHRQAQRRGGQRAHRRGDRRSLPTRATSSGRASSTRRNISRSSTRPRSRSGGRSSRPPASRGERRGGIAGADPHARWS